MRLHVIRGRLPWAGMIVVVHEALRPGRDRDKRAFHFVSCFMAIFPFCLREEWQTIRNKSHIDFVNHK